MFQEMISSFGIGANNLEAAKTNMLLADIVSL
jgi:hypothetical protein